MLLAARPLLDGVSIAAAAYPRLSAHEAFGGGCACDGMALCGPLVNVHGVLFHGLAALVGNLEGKIKQRSPF